MIHDFKDYKGIYEIHYLHCYHRQMSLFKKKSNIAHLLRCIEPLAVEPQNIELDFLQ